MEISGIIPPMVTPVTGRTGSVDTAALKQYVNHMREGGVDALFPCGTTGEFTSLTAKQRQLVIECVVEESGDTPVLAGCGGTSIANVHASIEHAAEAGAAAAVVVTPYYLSTTEDGLIEFYTMVADKAELPIILYMIPKFTNHRLSVRAVEQLAEHENIVAIKDSSGDLQYHNSLLTTLPDDFDVLQGSTHLTPMALTLGSSGATPGLGNIFPRVFAEMYADHQAGRSESVWETTRTVVYPMIEAGSEIPTIPQFKHLLSYSGLDVGPPLVPLPTLSDEERSQLEAHYDAVSAGL